MKAESSSQGRNSFLLCLRSLTLAVPLLCHLETALASNQTGVEYYAVQSRVGVSS